MRLVERVKAEYALLDGVVRTFIAYGRIGKETPGTVGDDLEKSVDKYAANEAFRCEGRSLTYAEFDALALYRGRGKRAATLYLSPRATARLRAAMSRFDLSDCARPDAADVEVVLGHPMAADPAWCDLTPMERLADAGEAYADLELVKSTVQESS